MMTLTRDRRQGRPLRPGAAALVVALAAAALLVARRSEGAGGESLAWKLSPDEALVYKLTGPDAKTVSDCGVEERTLWGGEIARDGRTLVAPVGRVLDVALHALYELPAGPVEPGAKFPVSALHALPPFNVGPLQVEGETRCLKKQGPVYQLETRLKLSRGPGAGAEARIEGGNVVATALFHGKKGQLAQGEIQIDWSEKQGTPPVSKSLTLKAGFEYARTIKLDPEKERKRADEAVRRALERELKPSLERAIWRQKQEDHRLGWLGALAYAAVKAGLDPQSGALAKAFGEIDDLPWKNTYSVSLALLALESRSVKRVTKGGGSRPRFEKEAVDKKDLELMQRLAAWLVDARFPGRGYWGYASYKDEGGKGERLGNGDLSVTQFACLALHAAARSGVKVPLEVWREMAEMLLANQEAGGPALAPDLRFEQGAPLARALGLLPPDEDAGQKPGGTTARPGTPSSGAPQSVAARGFMYAPPGFWRTPTGSMSGAGVSSAVIVRQELEAAKALEDERKKRLDAAILGGLVWLQQRGSPRFNWPENGWQPYYYLYSLEKAYELARVERAGGRDWWGEGVEELLLREKPGGGFGAEQYETAFAVLFLTRASIEPDFEVREPGREASGTVSPEDEDAVKVDGVGLVSAKEVLRATEVRDADRRRERCALAEKAVAAMDEEVRPILAPALGKLLSSAYAEPKRLAEKALREIAGERVEDEKAAQAYFARWDENRRLGLSGDADRIPLLRERLAKDRFPSERRAAALALSRLRAIEAVPDLAAELERPGDKEHRAYIHRVLVGTVGKDLGEAPAAWRAFYEESGQPLLAKEELRRDVARLARPETRAGARERLLAKGRGAVRPLIDALDSTPAAAGKARSAEEESRALALRSEAASLLRQITGQDFGDDRARWEAWWREQQ